MEPIAVIFDMDGLMLDTERMARSAWLHALSELNLEIGPSDYLKLIGRTALDTQIMVTDLFGAGLAYEALRERIQFHYDKDIAENGIPTKDGLLDLLDHLEKRGTAKAVATSATTHFAERKLRVAGIRERFETLVTSDMVRHGKPEPDLFLEAARRLGISPRRCVVLEDSEPGILAAQAAGMVPVMVPDLKPPAPEIRAICYRVLDSLHEVKPMLECFYREGLPGTAA